MDLVVLIDNTSQYLQSITKIEIYSPQMHKSQNNSENVEQHFRSSGILCSILITPMEGKKLRKIDRIQTKSHKIWTQRSCFFLQLGSIKNFILRMPNMKCWIRVSCPEYQCVILFFRIIDPLHISHKSMSSTNGVGCGNFGHAVLPPFSAYLMDEHWIYNSVEHIVIFLWTWITNDETLGVQCLYILFLRLWDLIVQGLTNER